MVTVRVLCARSSSRVSSRRNESSKSTSLSTSQASRRKRTVYSKQSTNQLENQHPTKKMPSSNLYGVASFLASCRFVSQSRAHVIIIQKFTTNLLSSPPSSFAYLKSFDLRALNDLLTYPIKTISLKAILFKIPRGLKPRFKMSPRALFVLVSLPTSPPFSSLGIRSFVSRRRVYVNSTGIRQWSTLKFIIRFG